MSQIVNVMLTSPLNPNLGPTFFITADVGTVSPGVLTATQLTAGYNVTVDNSATIIYVTPVFGDCKTPISFTITPPCVCYAVEECNVVGGTVTYKDCVTGADSFKTCTSLDKFPTLCARQGTVTTTTGAIITEIASVYGSCCSLECKTITFTCINDGSYSYISCLSGAVVTSTMNAGDPPVVVCGTFIRCSPGDITYSIGAPC